MPGFQSEKKLGKLLNFSNSLSIADKKLISTNYLVVLSKFNFQITGSFDEDPQSMQGYSLTDSNLENYNGVTLNIDQEKRELIVENIDAVEVEE